MRQSILQPVIMHRKSISLNSTLALSTLIMRTSSSARAGYVIRVSALIRLQTPIVKRYWQTTFPPSSPLRPHPPPHNKLSRRKSQPDGPHSHVPVRRTLLPTYHGTQSRRPRMENRSLTCCSSILMDVVQSFKNRIVKLAP